MIPAPRPIGAFLALCASMLLAGCDGSGGGSAPGPNVQLSGRVTYDFVPAVADIAVPTAQLDYAGTVARPARGVQVAVIAEDGSELASGVTDAEGHYVLSVPKNTQVRLRAVARLFQAPGGGASWDFSIRDNTSPGYADGAASIYAMQGDTFNTGVMHLTRHLHAGSGWTGAGYGRTRTAAPFAILDQIYDSVQKVLAVDEDAVFAPMSTYWSVANRPASGDKSLGEITTSHWDIIGTRPGLYILGKEDVDTDEYDTGVIVHEWGHYFESAFSRADSVGGPHGNGDLLDMRVAFGEGWGNALAGMVRDDPIYADTQGLRQSQPGVVMSLDEPGPNPQGWFNEAGVQHALYQMYTSPSIGFRPIYEVMIDAQKNTPAFTSLFSFATYLRQASDGAAQGVIDGLLVQTGTVSGNDLDIWGTNQMYPPDLGPPNDSVIPIYHRLTPDGTDKQVCGTDAFGDDFNKLGNYQFLRLTIDDAQAGAYVLKHQLDAPLGADDVAVLSLRSRGVVIAKLESEAAGYEVGEIDVALAPGDYALDAIRGRLPWCQTITLTKK